MSPVTGAIPCHAGKVLGAEPGGCCLEGGKLLERHLGLQQCGLQVSILAEAEEAALSPASTVPQGLKWEGSCFLEAAWERRGRHELAVCLHLLLHAGSGTEGRCRHAQEEVGNKLTSLPYHMLCVYRMFGFLLIPSRDSWHRRCRDVLCDFLKLKVSLPLSSTCSQVCV